MLFVLSLLLAKTWWHRLLGHVARMLAESQAKGSKVDVCCEENMKSYLGDPKNSEFVPAKGWQTVVIWFWSQGIWVCAT